MCFSTPNYTPARPPAAAPAPPIPGAVAVKKKKPTLSGRDYQNPLRIPRNDQGVGLK